MTECPTCGKPVDPIRARSVAVRDGKVVAFCSAACLAAAETQPVRMPSAQVPKLAPANADPVPAPAPAPTPAPVVEPAKAVEPAKLSKADRKKQKAKQPAIEAPKPAPEPAKAEPTKLEVKPEAAPRSASQIDIDSGPVIEILHEPRSGVVTSAPDRRHGETGGATSSETSGAIESDSSRARSDDTSPFRRGDTTPLPNKPRGPFATGSFILESDDPDFEVQADERPKRRAPIVVFLILLVVGGGALWWQLIYSKQDHKTAAVTPPPPPVLPAVGVDAPSLTANDAMGLAHEALRDGLRSTTPRIQQLAAAALGRTGDKESIAWLTAALDKASERAPRLDIAYALGRAGVTKGNDALATMLQSDSNARLDIGKRLAQLGDKRAIAALVGSLDTPQTKLSVAEYLAPFAEPHAVKALDEIRADASQPDRQKRAIIALGMAGKAEVTPQLREMLTDELFSAPAARALAELHDPAAKPVLVKELERPVLRVQAALALRRLEPGTDVVPLLPSLVAGLDDHNRDLDRISAAETIVILTGDAKLAERE